jgi:predicted lactoylglutathione lyase
MATDMLGRFLEISIHAPDVLDSLGFYERLGFTQASVGETWSHPYGVVTDGRLAIGLHRYEFPSPSLTFVQPDLMRRLESIEALGIDLAFRRVGADVFNEAGFTDPDGQMVALLEARTFSPVQRTTRDPSKLGWFEEIALPVRDLAVSGAFWERLGFVAAEQAEDPYPRTGLTSDSLNIGLWRTAHLERPALVFKDPEMPERIRRLQEAGIEFSGELPRMLDPARNALLVAPEGTLLLLLTE